MSSAHQPALVIGERHPDALIVARHESTLEAIIRYVLGHRRLTPVSADAVNGLLEESAEPSIQELLGGGSFLPGWSFSDAVYSPAGQPRYRLTPVGEALANPMNLFGFGPNELKKFPNGEADVLLALWAVRAFRGQGIHGQQSVRRAFLATQFQPDAVMRVVGAAAGLSVDELYCAAHELAAGAQPTTWWPGVYRDDISGAVDRLLSKGLIEQFAGERSRLLTPAYWERPERQFTTLRRVVATSKSLDLRARQLFTLLAARPSANKSRAGQGSATDKAAAEVRALWCVQAAISQVLTNHPDVVWGSASLWSIPRFAVYAAGQRFAGAPCALPPNGPDGSQHPAVFITQRIIDGVLWIGNDRPDAPSVMIEYEGAARNSRAVVHLLTALALSHRWDQPITLIFIVTTEARDPVIDRCRGLLGSPELRAMELGFPGANVDVRVVSHKTAVASSVLTAQPIWRCLFEIINGRGRHRQLVSTPDRS